VFTVAYDEKKSQQVSKTNEFESNTNGDFEYFGCYLKEEIKNFRFSMRSSYLTYQECKDHCQQTNNKYFSVQNGDSCYCGPEQWDVNKGVVDTSKCSSSCFEQDKDPKSNCGSSVFSIIVDEDKNIKVLSWGSQLPFGYIANFQYYGCYSNQDVQEFQFALQSKEMDLDRCQALCIQNNYIYFYVRDERDCICGSIDWDSNEEDELQDSLCSDECYRSDDGTQTCGNSIYSVNNYYQNRQYESRNEDDFKYFGCYMSLSIKTFKYAMKANAMTHQKCQDYCVQNKYSYFYIKDDTSCYCENSKWPSQFGKMIDSQCSEECYENEEELCGNSVYFIKNADQNIVYAQTTENAVLQSYGCYLNEDIKDFKFAMQSPQKITYEACQSYCVQNSYGYFFLQKESVCYCGASNWVSKSGSVTGTQCAPDCNTKSSKPCGTQVFLSREYNQDANNEKIEVEFDYNGCYLDKDVENFKTAFKADYITFTFCENQCRQQNYQYFYIAGGDSCNCGKPNWDPKFGKVQDSKCSTECYANSNEVCGNSVYTVTDGRNQTSSGNAAYKNEFSSGLTTELALHGCYLDQDTENFKFSMKAQDMSYKQCQRYCRDNNFRYFYVQEMSACHCGASNWVPKYGKVHKDRCSSECYGSFDQLCGNFVYYVDSYENVNSVDINGNWSYYGCYENQDMNSFQLGFQQQSMTYQSCQSYCYQQQYSYCYVETENCFCGSSSSTWQAEKRKLQDSSCTFECYENKATEGGICGRRIYSWSDSKNESFVQTSQSNNVQSQFGRSSSQNSWESSWISGNRWGDNSNQYGVSQNVWGNYNPQGWSDNWNSDYQNRWNRQSNDRWNTNENSWSNQNNWNNNENSWNNQNQWNNNKNSWDNQIQWNNKNSWNNQNQWNNNKNSWDNQNQWNINKNRWSDQNNWSNQDNWNDQNSWENQNSWYNQNNKNNQDNWNDQNNWNNQNNWNVQNKWNNQNNWNDQNKWDNQNNWNDQNKWDSQNNWNDQNKWDNQNNWNDQNKWNSQNSWSDNQNRWENRWNSQNSWNNNNQNMWNSWSNSQNQQSEFPSDYYYGCYLNQDVNSFQLVMKQNDMTNEKCNQICAQNSFYFYVQDQSSCYCGSSNWVSKFGKVQDDRCSSRCYDDSAQECGNKVYTTATTTQQMTWNSNQNSYSQNYKYNKNQQNNDWQKQSSNNQANNENDSNSATSFDLSFFQPFMTQLFKGFSSDANSQDDNKSSVDLNQLLKIFSNFSTKGDQNESTETEDPKMQYKGEYSMWRKKGDCEGQCFSRGKQEYTRFCIDEKCDPSVKTTKYQSCIVTKGC